MLAFPMIDPMGAIVTELRQDGDVALLVRDRVRGGRAAPDDARGPLREDEVPQPGFHAFVVVAAFDDAPHPSVPIQRALYGISCYGTTDQNARAVWGAVVKALHLVRARRKANGLGIYISAIDSGGEADTDPETGQPVVRGTVRVIATAQALA